MGSKSRKFKVKKKGGSGEVEEDFAMIVQKALNILSSAENKQYRGVSRAILDYLLSEMYIEDRCTFVTREEIANHIGTTPDEVSRHINRLIAGGFLSKREKLGAQTVYYFDENIVRKRDKTKGKKAKELELELEREKGKLEAFNQVAEQNVKLWH